MGKKNKKLTTEQYKNELKGINASVDIIDSYIDSQTPIKHKCKNCNNILLLKPNSVKEYAKHNRNICKYCNSNSFCIGKNDLWTTHPDIAKMLVDKSFGYTVTSYSEKLTDWICPDCGEIILQKSVNNTVHNGLICPVCGYTRSLGHRIMNSILSLLNVDYINEKTFNWSDGKLYDIYIPNYNCIIETHGLQHYEYCNLLELSNKSIEDEKNNDLFKYKNAIDNGIKYYISIDCRESDFEYIYNSIINNNDLNNFLSYNGYYLDSLNINDIYNKCITKQIITIMNMYNKGKHINEICKEVKLSDSVVQRHLHILTDRGLCNYKGFEERFKPVICLNTKEIFDNIKLASEKYNIYLNNISFVCHGARNRKYAGKLKDGTKLKWMFLDDYNKLNESEIDDILNKKQIKKSGKSKVVCLNTGEVFTTIKEAILKYPDAKSISDCCRHIAKSTGTNNNGEKLKWIYYSEYSKLSKEDINIILNEKIKDNRILCINTNVVYDNFKIASNIYNLYKTALHSARNRSNNSYFYCGKDDCGNKLEWIKYTDYLKLNKN